MSSLQFEKPPRPWECLDAGRAVRVGDKILRLTDVAHVETGEHVEPNVDGHLMGVGLFFGLGALFLVPVLMQVAPLKVLGGALLFLGIGATALGEIRRSRAIRITQVQITLLDGRIMTFSTTEPAQAQALALALTAARLGNSTPVSPARFSAATR